MHLILARLYRRSPNNLAAGRSAPACETVGKPCLPFSSPLAPHRYISGQPNEPPKDTAEKGGHSIGKEASPFFRYAQTRTPAASDSGRRSVTWSSWTRQLAEELPLPLGLLRDLLPNGDHKMKTNARSTIACMKCARECVYNDVYRSGRCRSHGC